MFNDNFYPTPEALINRMFSKIDFRNVHYILEPSSGKGDICDKLTEKYKRDYEYALRHNPEKLDEYLTLECIEIEPELINTLQGKSYNVIDSDFITFEPIRFYDLIIMNPPFSDGCNHLLKAISIQERLGGQVVCILNSETLKNDYSNNRKILSEKLNQYNADIEYIQNAFTDAERKTGVEVALITVNIPMANIGTMFEKELKETQNISLDSHIFNEVIPNMSKLEKLVFECDMIKKSCIKLFEEQRRIDIMLSNFGLSSNIGVCDCEWSNTKLITVNQFIDKINLKYWEKFINETDFKSKLPSKLRDTFTYGIERQRKIEFNLENIRYFTAELLNAIPQAYEETVANVFDDLTRKYHYSDSAWSNTIHMFNGWKTNDCFKINKKVIFTNYSRYSSYGLNDTLKDLNIIFENISNVKDDICNNQELIQQIKNFGKKIETTHFIIDSYKKGTIHVTFKNQKHLDNFNILACKGKKWLPMDFGTKPYNDMDEEEKRLCAEFGLSQSDYTAICGKIDYLRLT